MRILVTGGAGYLGSVLVRKLVSRRHAVRVLDVGYFGLSHLQAFGPQVEVVRADIRRLIVDRRFGEELVSGCDCIIHLAAISNDPSAELNPQLTHDVNFVATEALARIARAKRVRLLFSSSCSVYGEADAVLDEEGPVKPLTAYAASKVNAEQALLALADASWSPIILRNGTLFGYSPRMRFDLVANIFAMCSVLYNEIRIFGSGLQWRPFLHVSDCASAFIYFAERSAVRYHTYNVAHQNLRVVDLAEIFERIQPGLRVVHLDTADEDHRDYFVSTSRLESEGFHTRVDLDLGTEEMIEAIVSHQVPDPESVYYRNAKWLTELSQLGSKEHVDIVSLMETLADVRTRARVPA